MENLLSLMRYVSFLSILLALLLAQSSMQGSRFRKQRRIIQQNFNQRASREYEGLQERQNNKFLNNLLHAPRDFAQHAKHLAASTILKIAYGHEVKSLDDEFVALPEQVGGTAAEIGATSVGAMLVDFFPMLRHVPSWIPGADFKRRAIALHKDFDAFLSAPFEMVKRNMKSGTAEASFTSTHLEKHAQANGGFISAEDEEDIKCVAGHLFAGLPALFTILNTNFTSSLAAVDTACFPHVYTHLQFLNEHFLDGYYAVNLHPGYGSSSRNLPETASRDRPGCWAQPIAGS
jgi:hypothetical protein